MTASGDPFTIPQGHAGWPGTFNALDFVQFDADGNVEIFFQNQVPENLEAGNVIIFGASGKTRIVIGTVQIVPSPAVGPDAHLLVTLNPPLTRREMRAEYEIQLVEMNEDRTPGKKPLRGFDPHRSVARLSASVATSPDKVPEESIATPEINYLSKDFASFKQLMLDRLSMTLPQWTEQNPSDLMVTLVELLAYFADYLSYFQDSVGTEAFLNTARKRISVRRLARLIDYTMREGCNARAWVCVEISQQSAVLEFPYCFFAGHDDASFPDFPAVLGPAQLQRMENLLQSYVVYEPVSRDKVYLLNALNQISIHTYGGRDRALPKGATSAALVDCVNPPSPDENDPPDCMIPLGTEKTPGLRIGDVLIFEERVSPITKQVADRDTLHRHAVRLTGMKRDVDRVTNTPLLHVTWDAEDALPAPFVLTVPGDRHGSEPLNDVTIVRGNVILVDHGQTINNESINPPPVRWYKPAGACASTKATPVSLPSLFSTVVLSNSPLTHSQPLAKKHSATTAMMQDERQAVPCVSLRQSDADNPTLIQWSPRTDLLRSEAEDPHFVAEIDDGGRACLRFGDGVNGRRPDPVNSFSATYRIGNGTAGNIGAEQIKCLVFPDRAPPDIKVCDVRNPLAATGGANPESMDEVRVYAPTAFQQVLERAVTPADYVALAQAVPGVQRAAAVVRWSGTRQIIKIAIDPLGTDKPVPDLLKSIRRRLERYRLIGQEIHVDPAIYVSVKLEVSITPESTADAFHLKSQICDILGSTRLPNGKLGFFHPDNFTFATPVSVNRIVTACKIRGVRGVQIKTLQRLNGATSDSTRIKDLTFETNEIARLDVDPLNSLRGLLKVCVYDSDGGAK